MSVNHSSWALDCKVYVGGLGSGIDKEELEREFKEYGALKNVWVARNPPGFAFIEYRYPRDAEDAVKGLDGILMNGRRIMVQMSTGKAKSILDRSRSRSTSGDSYHRDSTKKRYRGRSRSRSSDSSETWSFISRSRSITSRSSRSSCSSRSRHYSREKKSRSYKRHCGSRSYRKSYARSRSSSFSSESSYDYRRRDSRSRSQSVSSLSIYSVSSASSGHSLCHKRSHNCSEPSNQQHATNRNVDHGNENGVCGNESTSTGSEINTGLLCANGGRKCNENIIQHVNNVSSNQSDSSSSGSSVGPVPTVNVTTGTAARVTNGAVDAAVQTDLYLLLHFVQNPDILSDTFLRLDRDNVLNNCNYPEIIPSVYQRRSNGKNDTIDLKSQCLL